MRWLLAGLLLVVGCQAAPPTAGPPPRRPAPSPAPPPAPPPPPAAVVADAVEATRAATRILDEGGNAFDAAVAAAFVLGVVHPHASGIGGGGFALTWDSGDARAYDFREEAPQVLRGEALSRRPLDETGAAVGVPGEVAGLAALHRRGTLSWRRVLEPAITIAREGFEPDAALVEAVRWRKATLSPALVPVLLDEGGAAKTGTVRRPRLARTLARVAEDGPAAFYRALAPQWAEAASAVGGTLTAADFESYQVRETEPLQITRDGQTLLTAPPSSSGGLVLGETWALHAAPLTDHGPTLHHFAEAVRVARADAAASLLGDIAASEAASLVDAERLAGRAHLIQPETTTPPPGVDPAPGGTSAVVVVDREGQAVALVTSLGAPFGSEIAVEGVVLNAALLAFAREDQRRRVGARDGPRSRARPLSPLTPALLSSDGHLLAAAAATGGEHAATALAQVLVRVEPSLPLGPLLALPRARVPRTGGLWLEEVDRWSPSTLADLARRHEQVRFQPPDPTAVLLAVRGPEGWLAAADPRKGGAAAMR